MEDLGSIFKTARLKKKVTPSQAAAATRMKVQHVEALERGDFSRMAAPMYAKGFIKIYADYLGLDPQPLVKLYMDNLAPAQPVVQVPPSVIVPKAPDEEPAPRPGWKMIFRLKWPAIKLPRFKLGKPVLYGGLAAIALVALASLILSRDQTPLPPEPLPTPTATVQAATPTPPPPVASSGSAFMEEPPEPYIESDAQRTEHP